MAESAPYATDGLTAAGEDFVRRFPGYASTAAIDELRAVDYSRLDRLGHTYLDYTGGGLYAESQLRRHQELLAARVLGNPHSQSPTSQAAADLAGEARDAVRRLFHAPEDEFEIVFTANASGALKLVGEAYPFAPGGVFLLSYDNHNSVNGIREFACRKGAAATYIPVREDDLRLDEVQVRTALRAAPVTAGRSCSRIPHSPISAAHSIRSAGSPRRMISAGTSSSTAPPSRRPTARRRSDRRRLHPDLVLQALRLPDRGGLSHRPPGSAGQAAPALVRRRHDHPRLGAGGGLVPPRAGGDRLRGRHHRLPRPARGDDRHRACGEDRPAADPRARAGPCRMAARGDGGAAAQRRLAADPGVRPAGHGATRRHHRAVSRRSRWAPVQRVRRRGGCRPRAHLGA